MSRGLELKVPPVAVVLIVAAAMWLLSIYVPALAFPLPWHKTLAALLAAAGVTLGLAGVVTFRRAGTTVHPHRPDKTSALVTSGVYRYTRNPMYLGLLLALTAWAVYLAHVLAFALLPAFVVYMNRFQITPEENALSEKFGPAFVAYKRSVRRWL